MQDLHILLQFMQNRVFCAKQSNQVRKNLIFQRQMFVWLVCLVDSVLSSAFYADIIARNGMKHKRRGCLKRHVINNYCSRSREKKCLFSVCEMSQTWQLFDLCHIRVIRKSE